ncbi:hypothetical protein [Streptomyces eurythermus]
MARGHLARALGLIRPGAVAGLAAVPGDPLGDIRLMGRGDFVVQRGRVRRHDRP